ncbi:hypothetical protein [Aeoliella sp.]|uniref:hypothetical protein n=1 Tax=Aeoliella sp. TaxID=2795800 RepID=UPI003CCBE286
MENSGVSSLLKRVRQRQWWIDGTAACCWAIVAAAGLLLVAMWLDLVWELAPQVRIAAMVVASIVGLGALALLVWRTWLLTSDEYAARRLDSAGGLGGMMLSGWELSRAPATANSHSLSAGLSQMAVGRAAELGSRVPTSKAVPVDPAKRAATVLLSLGGGILLVGLCLPTLATTQWRRFVSPYADVPPFSRLEFEVTPGDTEVVYGQGLDVRATISGEPIEQASLVFESAGEEDEVPMFPEGDGQWRAALSRVTEPSSYFVRAEGSRSKRYQIEVITVPNIESVRFQVSQPEYARQAVYKGPLPDGGLSGLAGAKVKLWAKSNRPLSGGRVEVVTEEGSQMVDLKPTAEGDNEVTGTFTINTGGRFAVTVSDTEHQESLEPFAGAITLLEDQKPFVRMIQPRETSIATPHIHLPIEISAEDDYGVARLQLYRSLNNSRPLPLEYKIEDVPPRRMREMVYLPLPNYRLQPGDEIKVYARVEDNDPAGAKGSESPVATVRIISQEDFERMVRQQRGLEVLTSKYQQAARRMEKMAEELRELQEQLDDLPPDSELADEIRDKLQELSEQMKKEAEAVEKAAEQLLPYDLDEALTDELKKAAETLAEAAEAAEKLAKKKPATNSEAASEMEKMANQLSEERKEFDQQASLPLDLLSKVYPLLENESKFIILVQRQRDLAERMAVLKGLDSPDDPAMKARMRDLEGEQRKIREELDELVADIELRAERLPNDERLDKLRQSAMQFAAAVLESGATEAMLDAEMGLLEFNGDDAVENATKAADILESLLGQCNGMGGQCQGALGFNPTLSNGMGNTLQQLLNESGLGGVGSGMGQGSGGRGGGYSARRTGGNVGMYGGMRGMGQSSGNQQGQGSRNANADGQGDGSGYGIGGTGRDPNRVEMNFNSEAAGSSQGSVPLRYRRRVGRYLQELAEELNQE